MDLEIWRDVIGYEGLYQISDHGNVRSLDRLVKGRNGFIIRRARSITVRKSNFGYMETRLCKDGRKKSAFLHRVLAEVFIPNPLRKPDVNHKNGIKADNRLCNLEWCTERENAKHAFLTGLQKHPSKNSRRVRDTRTGRIYNSIRQAARENDLPYISFKNAMNGIRKNNTGFEMVD